MSKRTSYGKNYRSDVHTRPRLSRGCDFIHGRFLPSALVKICLQGHCVSAQMHPNVRANALIPSPPYPFPPSYALPSPLPPPLWT
jgi:hypothetical protein